MTNRSSCFDHIYNERIALNRKKLLVVWPQHDSSRTSFVSYLLIVFAVCVRGSR